MLQHSSWLAFAKDWILVLMYLSSQIIVGFSEMFEWLNVIDSFMDSINLVRLDACHNQRFF